ncbi:glycosyl hydrolase [Leptospira tipperaryensis]|uniref:Glycosyl hydrolase n=1 Tax=Leptospira tipperaryensis TaxID=2564040 RepID=A0A1D7V1M6_9LEPT|nr:glycosyl hydrolase family 18 protein [Leptospira tipperaryensis]AOP35738.1 glycosyl hydrolase [Leptospira tipperaryensis]
MIILRILTLLCFFDTSYLWAKEPTPIWNYTIHQSIERESPAYWTEIFSKSHTLCFTGTYLRADGSLKSIRLPETFFTLGQKHKVRLIPLVTSSHPHGWYFLKTESGIQNSIESLIHFIEQNPNLSGLHFDIEYISNSQIPNYKRFLKELRKRLPRDKVLTLALFPQIEFPNLNSKIHAELLDADFIDEFVLMSYDFHSSKTKPGPVTSLSWTKKNLEFLSGKIPSSKLWLGLPLYGYFWKKDGKVKIIDQRTLAKNRNRFEITYGEDGFMELKDETGIGYISDGKSLYQLQGLTERYQLKGTGFWRIGF